MKQEAFTDIEYYFHKNKTKREEFLEIMDEIIPWEEWVDKIKPYYPAGKRGRPPMGIEKMLRMYLLQIWGPSHRGCIYDSYAMRKFTGIDFMTEAVPDETTLSSLPNVSDNAIDWERCMENRKSSVPRSRKRSMNGCVLR